MKNTIKKLTSLLVLVMIFVSSIALSACSGKNTNASKDTAIETTTDTNQTQTPENAGDSETDTENTEDAEETKVYKNGIYKITKDVKFEDTWFEDQAEGIKFFKTTDLNGVYNIVKKLGFDEYFSYEHIENEVTYKIGFHFNNGIVTPIAYDDNENYFYPSGYQSATYEDFSKLAIVETDDNNQVTSLSVKFVGSDDVETPLYARIHVALVENSSNLEFEKSFKYKANTAVLNFDENAADADEKLKELAKLFNIPEDSDVKSEVIAKLSDWTFSFSKEFDVLKIENSNNSFSFAEFDESENAFKLLGINLRFEDHTLDLESGSEEFVAITIVTENTTLTFKIAKI